MTNPSPSAAAAPPRASFASALAQKPPVAAASSSPSGSPSKTAPAPIKTSATTSQDSGSIVKLPSSSQATTTDNKTTTPTATPTSSDATTKPAPPVIKFGSFAAAAASASMNDSGVVSIGAPPTLPPRTQSAPPNVIEQQQKSVSVPVASVPSAATTNTLPAIQEDSQAQAAQAQSHVQPQQFQNYDGASPYYTRQPHQNPNYAQQSQRYYQQQQQHQQYHQFQPQQYHHQHQYQYQNQQYNNPNYRNPHHSYRPRPQYHQTAGYYNQQQQGYYPQGGYANYNPAAQDNQNPTAIPFQRPAPVLTNFSGPVVTPVVPANMPGFTESGIAPAAVAVAPSTSTATAPIAKPAPSKIKIVDPTTGKELNFGASKPAEPSKKEDLSTVEVSLPAVVEVKVAPAPAPVKPVEVAVKATPVSAPRVSAVPVSAPVPVKVTPPVLTPAPASTTPSAPATPAKKISIVIKDPNSHKELDLNQFVARPVVVIKDDLAVEELTAAFNSSTKLDESEGFLTTSSSPMPLSESPVSPVFEHDKGILANLNVDDDILSDDDDEDEDDYSDYSDEEEIYIPSTVQFNQSISYPEVFIPFKAPVDQSGVWLYSREFMMQFREKCKTTPGDLQERLSAAVEKAKAFASSDRINGGGSGDRSHRRNDRGGEGHRGGDDRKKRRNDRGGPLGPQAHLLDMNAVLKNRAENAWTPVKSAEELSQVERIIREVKGLLNKLTLEKFHVISDKILALGIMSPDVLFGVIDCVFDKSVSEPRFAPMYAELCYKIVVEELNELKKTLPGNVNPDSQFRRLLVERCQAEYKHKRAWSKKRLEKLLETTTEGQESIAVVAPESATPVAAAAAVGELTEEDYLLIKLKRRVLGNMRFIGEIFKVGLIGEKIMHSIITELLSNVENPEEEEIECLCRLLMTVGAILDKPEAANFWNQYIGRMNWLISQSGKLSSRVRFLVMDTLELRDKKWKTGKGDEGPKTIAQIQKDQQNKERGERERERDYRDNRGGRGGGGGDARRGGNDHRDQRSGGDARDHNRDSRDRNPPATATTTAPLKFTIKSKTPSSSNERAEEWNCSGNGKTGSSQLSRGPSFRRPQTPVSVVAVESPTSAGGRFDVLGMEGDKVEATPTTTATNCDPEKIKKIVSLLDELVQMNNYADIYEEIKLVTNKASALSGLLNRAIEGGKKASLSAVIRVFLECPDVDRTVQLDACKASFGMIDDLAVDVPSVYEAAGQLFSALSLSLPEIFDCLLDCSDDSAKTRTILYTISAASTPEHKDSLLQAAKQFVESNKKPAIENLIKKLNIEI